MLIGNKQIDTHTANGVVHFFGAGNTYGFVTLATQNFYRDFTQRIMVFRDHDTERFFGERGG